MIKFITSIFFFTSVALNAQEPQLKGGLSAYLRENTIYPAYSLQNCIQGTVSVAFKLNGKGEVYYATVTRGIGTDLDDEALRLIKLSSGKWEVPQNHDTTSLVLMPMSFTLRDSDCNQKSKGAIATAIQAYTANEELRNVILTYYRNKEKGSADPADEAKIIRLKGDLGIDDEYLQSRIETGLKKVNQGDHSGACEDFLFVKYMGSNKADGLIAKHCN
ncbi:MAG: TonB family protein [Pedobacter sp.]|nr:MAG: TonB family protein [Pedobacter sp.]